MNRKFDELLRQTDKTNFMNTEEYLKMEAREEGLAEGREVGLAEGREAGLAEGRTEIQMNVVRNLLLSTDFSDPKIADIAGVSEQFVGEMREGNHQ